MNDWPFRSPRALFIALVMLAWTSDVLAQAADCPNGFQDILISGDREVLFYDPIMTLVGSGQVCYNPAGNCFVGFFRDLEMGGRGETIPFQALAVNKTLTINTIPSCGDFVDSRNSDFHLVLSDTGENDCFESLTIVNRGDASGGMLVGDGSVNIMLDTGVSIMMDVPYMPDAVNPQRVEIGPILHEERQFAAFVPTDSNGAVQVMNEATGMPVGTADGICGVMVEAAPQSSSVIAVPALSRWGLLVLCLGLVLTVVWRTRRRFEA